MSVKYQAIDWYDLPKYYEAVFSAETQREADFLEAVARRHGRHTKHVLEPACGSGRLVHEMARRGYRVIGFDANTVMVDYARRRISRHRLHANVLHGLLEEFVLPQKFDLAHCLVSTFKYVLDEDGACSHLESIATHLRPGGLYVLGFHLTEYDSGRKIRERWTTTVGRAKIVCNIQIWPADRRKRLERVRSRLRVTLPEGEKRFETHWSFRTYDAGQVRRLLRKVPILEHVATHDFTCDIRREIALDDRQLDVVLILRKAGA